jgi:hypothetical protein
MSERASVAYRFCPSGEAGRQRLRQPLPPSSGSQQAQGTGRWRERTDALARCRVPSRGFR